MKIPGRNLRRNRHGTVTVRAWAIVAACICGLLIAIGGASVIAFVQNERVRDVIQDAISYELEVEDEGDDLRAAVLDVRHYHRDIAFNGPSSNALANLDAAYADLLEEITEFGRINMTLETVMSATEIRDLANEYYNNFWPAIDLYEEDPAAFLAASDEGLRQLERLDRGGEGHRRSRRATHRGNACQYQSGDQHRAFYPDRAPCRSCRCRDCAGDLGRWRPYSHGGFIQTGTSLTQELTRNLRTKADFIGDASHELRTPLTIIQGNAEIGIGATDDSVRQSVLSEIWAESTRMSRLVDDLLFLARSDAGRPCWTRSLSRLAGSSIGSSGPRPCLRSTGMFA